MHALQSSYQVLSDRDIHGNCQHFKSFAFLLVLALLKWTFELLIGDQRKVDFLVLNNDLIRRKVPWCKQGKIKSNFKRKRFNKKLSKLKSRQTCSINLKYFGTKHKTRQLRPVSRLLRPVSRLLRPVSRLLQDTATILLWAYFDLQHHLKKAHFLEDAHYS